MTQPVHYKPGQMRTVTELDILYGLYFFFIKTTGFQLYIYKLTHALCENV